jgi:predicted outer membrane repeat protein
MQHCSYCSVAANLLGEDLQLFYITPSSNVPCAVKYCLTLSQFADNSSSWLSSLTGASLMLLSGIHTLTTDFSISAINFFMLTSSTSDVNHFIISCHYRVSFNFENVSELSIKGLVFTGCGNNIFSSIRTFTIENSIFQGRNGSGTVLDIIGVNLTIVNSSFLSNSIGRCLDIFDFNTTPRNISVHVGGAIFVDKSNVSIIECTFFNNSAEVGGAIYSTSYEFNNNISISNSTFINNRANTNSPSLVHFCDQRNNSSMRSGAGAIAVFQSKLNITDSTFTNNTSETGEGGVLAIQQESTLSICKSRFYGNNAKSYGGVFMTRQVSATINNSVFINNSAAQGGVAYAIQMTTIVLRGNVFRNNSAISSGGVMSMDENSLLYDHHSQFSHNKATTGGVLYAIRSGVRLEDSAFSHNQAKERGGAIYVLQSRTNIIFLGRCNLTHNSASTGGAILCAIESTVTVVSLGYIYIPNQLTQLTVAFNSANFIGGGIYLHRSVFNSRMDNVTNISYNNANRSGGGMYATNSLIICTEYYHKMNTKPYQTLIFFANNRALKGGGLYLESTAQLRIQKMYKNTDNQNASLR